MRYKPIWCRISESNQELDMCGHALVIALAESTFDLIQPMIKAGKLPTFARISCVHPGILVRVDVR